MSNLGKLINSPLTQHRIPENNSETIKGGATTLITLNENIIPQKGMLLLFDHKILHAGQSVTTGVKYVLRTDVMYRLKKYENE